MELVVGLYLKFIFKHMEFYGVIQEIFDDYLIIRVNNQPFLFNIKDIEIKRIETYER